MVHRWHRPTVTSDSTQSRCILPSIPGLYILQRRGIRIESGCARLCIVATTVATKSITLGSNYHRTDKTTTHTFGTLPVVYS